MRIFNKYFYTLIIFLFILLVPKALWAMSEDEYATMATQNIVVMHEAQGDPKIVSEKSKEFLGQFSEEKKQEYIAMAHRVMKDKELAHRVSEKIINFLIQTGYKVVISPEGDINSISIAAQSAQSEQSK